MTICESCLMRENERVRLQAEVADAKALAEAALDAKHAKLVEVADKLQVERGALERARGLLREAHGQYGMPIGIDERIGAFLATPPTPIATPGTSPREKLLVYCELAESEIPNFGTDRDTHRCAKMHHRTPWPVHATPGTPTEEET